MRTTWWRAAGVTVVAAAIVGGCAPAPKVPDGPGGVTSVAMSSRQLLARDIDHPPAPDCSTARYEHPTQSKLPEEFKPDNYKLTSERDPRIASVAHQLCGSRGPGVDLAWGVTHGRSDVVIAVLDSGVKWTTKKNPEGNRPDIADLADQAYLNRAELPKPSGSSDHDSNGDGVFNVEDYANDPRVTDRNHNGLLDPEDLILTASFNDGVDTDGNGYVDDISGWDFLFDDNDPNDDVDYGHGTGEARDSTAKANGGGGSVGTCPGCMFLPVRVGDSFIAEGGTFAAGVLFALDSKASIIQEALGVLNNPTQSQAAIDAAYRRGVPVIASMADEASKHPNLPAAQDHTIPVNSITSTYGFLGDLTSLMQDDLLALNGCTNYGGIAWVTVPSGSCSSEATGLSAGMVGLMLSQARDVGLDPPLTSNEVAQILRGTADDIDFATPRGATEPANEHRGDQFERYPTAPGWDATFGFGRVNTYESVRAVTAKEIPPEADLTGPKWFDVLPTTGTVPVIGTVAANRSTAFGYRVEWAAGLQPPPHPANDAWHVVESADGQTERRTGTLATLDLAQIASALPNGGHGPSSDGRGKPNEDRFAVRVRVVVTDADGRVAVNQRQVFVHDDPDVLTSLTRRVPGAGAPSPAFANLDGSAGDELVVATDDGAIHAFRADGSEIPGWPVRSSIAPWWHATSLTAVADHVPPAHAGFGVGAPIVANLMGDGAPEVAAADMAGHVTVWDHTGRQLAQMAVDPNYSTPSATNETNRMKRGFLAEVSAGDLDGDGALELVAAALDRHVYAWHPDGTPVPGFPVLVVDSAQVETVEPVTHHIEWAGTTHQGGELVVTPAVGDLDGDGKAEIVVGSQEQHPDAVSVFPGIGLPGVSGNTRVFAIWGDGNDHPATAATADSPNPSAFAYLPGWPVPLAMVLTGVLPTVGDGVNTQAAIGDVNGDGHPEVVVSSSAGPVYALSVAGRSIYDPYFGQQVALPWLGAPFGSSATSLDGGIVVSAFGGPALGNLDTDSLPDVAVPTVGLGRALDQLLPGHQQGDTQLMAYNGRTGAPLDGFPSRTSDLAFFVTPAIVDVDGDGLAEVVAANGVDLLDAVNMFGVDAPGFPKLTGGWSVGTPAFGDIDGDGTAEMAITRRDGVLEVWRTRAGVGSLDQWPRFGHDGRNSGGFSTPTRP